MDEGEKSQLLRAKRTKSIADVLEEVEVVVDMHFSTNSQEESPHSSFRR